MDDRPLGVNQDVLNSILKSNFKKRQTKINKDALKLASQFIGLLVSEAVNRSAEDLDESNPPDNTTIDTEQLERILPQLLLDF
ncbi:hypothetical protein K501DRAFT_6720 [Backusella circina FSU 941]|nr:hypothetical protein K501DRAFT_6720 [Backusella circina FSU 941]